MIARFVRLPTKHPIWPDVSSSSTKHSVNVMGVKQYLRKKNFIKAQPQKMMMIKI
jgi:hypothetical protein